MKKTALFSCMLFLFWGLKAQDTNTFNFSLEQCIEYAFKKNYQQQSLELSKDISELSYKQSKLERLPSLNANLSESFSNSNTNGSSWSGNYSLNASMPLFNGFSIENTIEQQKLLWEQSDLKLAQAQNDLTIQILQAFLTILGNQELLKYRSEVIKATDEQLKQGEARFKMGAILESDYLLLQAQYADDQANIVETEIAIENNLLTLKQLLALDPEKNLQIIYPDMAAFTSLENFPSKEDAISRAKAFLPILKIQQYNIDIAQMDIRLAKSSYYPSLNLSAGLGSGHSPNYQNFGTQLSDRFQQQASLSLNIPIYNNNRTNTKVKQSKIQLQQAELSKQQSELDVLQEITQGYHDVLSAHNKYKAYDIKQNAYSKTFDVYRAQYNVGAVTTVDLLQQQNNYISALNEYIQSKYSFILKRKILDVYMGIKPY